MSTYQPNIPTGTVNLDEDYINIRNNFQQLNTTYGVDHYEYDNQTSSNGYHKAVHLVQQVAPSAVASVGSLYCTTVNDGLDTDEILYYKTGLNKVLQLTRNFVPVLSGGTLGTSGRTFLPGGLIIQWGVRSFVGQTLTPVTFAAMGGIAFPNACYNVQATMNEVATSGVNVLNVSSLSATGFSYYNTSSSSRSFYWFAIGN